MTNMSDEKTVRESWQSQGGDTPPPSMDDVRAGADKFYRAVRRRNVVEYAACVVVVVIFAIYAFTMQHPMQKIGSVLIVVAAIYTPWQLHRRGSAVPPEKAGEMPLYLFLRGQLVRQRDALRGIFWWYILPFLPGLVLFNISFEPSYSPQRVPVWVILLASAGIIIVIGGIWWLNQLGASKLQKHIDDIDALLGEQG
jgi:hypothetical protein